MPTPPSPPPRRRRISPSRRGGAPRPRRARASGGAARRERWREREQEGARHGEDDGEHRERAGADGSGPWRQPGGPAGAQHRDQGAAAAASRRRSSAGATRARPFGQVAGHSTRSVRPPAPAASCAALAPRERLSTPWPRHTSTTVPAAMASRVARGFPSASRSTRPRSGPDGRGSSARRRPGWWVGQRGARSVVPQGATGAKPPVRPYSGPRLLTSRSVRWRRWARRARHDTRSRRGATDRDGRRRGASGSGGPPRDDRAFTNRIRSWRSPPARVAERSLSPHLCGTWVGDSPRSSGSGFTPR